MAQQIPPAYSDGGPGSIQVPDDESVIAYFGYGSLVNTATHRTETVGMQPARLVGKRRAWRARPDMPGFPAALLTVQSVPNHGCDGLLVIDRLSNLTSIDMREARYKRREVASHMFEQTPDLPSACPVYVYEALSNVPMHPRPPRILRSYLDAVMQGFLHHFGEAGVLRFIAETDNWEISIADDREAPIYPRSVIVSAEETGFFDGVLKNAGIQQGLADS